MAGEVLKKCSRLIRENHLDDKLNYIQESMIVCNRMIDGHYRSLKSSMVRVFLFLFEWGWGWGSGEGVLLADLFLTLPNRIRSVIQMEHF